MALRVGDERNPPIRRRMPPKAGIAANATTSVAATSTSLSLRMMLLSWKCNIRAVVAEIDALLAGMGAPDDAFRAPAMVTRTLGLTLAVRLRQGGRVTAQGILGRSSAGRSSAATWSSLRRPLVNSGV